jgi:DNA-binding transcriptional MerR regulator
LFDISKATLFRWEREGVITEPARDWRNWRLYTRKNVEEIEKVIRARKAVV